MEECHERNFGNLLFILNDASLHFHGHNPGGVLKQGKCTYDTRLIITVAQPNTVTIFKMTSRLPVDPGRLLCQLCQRVTVMAE